MTRILLCAALAIVAAPQSALPADGPENLIRNAAFETDADQDGVPDGWTTSGARGVVQHITMVEGREGGKAAKLACTEFVDGSPSSHAMICQLGVVGAKRGQWYRLTFWAKGKGLKRPIVSAALRDTKTWGDSGITGSFPVSATWRRVELTFQAKQDVPAETSRLQIWFASTGELWLGDLVFARTQIRRQYQPQIAAKGVGNPIPNSSFEAGTAGWGSWSPSIRYWGGNVFRLLGEVDDTTAAHGRRSLRLRVDKGHMPTFYFDYFDPLAVPIHALTAGHKGWAPVEPGKPYVLSCSLKADAADVPAVLMVHHSPWSRVTKEVKVGPGWQRFSCPFTVQRDAVWAAVGVDLETSELDSATLWIDAVQIEPGQAPTEYAPRRPVESFIDTPAQGNIFTDPAAGMTVRVVACNAGDGPERVSGQLVVTDFFGREVSRDKLDLPVVGHGRHVLPVKGMMRGRRGFYRVEWIPSDGSAPFPQTLRCALIDPYGHDDSPFGMNHAYPWAFMLRLAKQAGLTSMRDWSVKWHTVEPERGAFDFSVPDAQIDRVLAEGLDVPVMFPFASAHWCSSADMAKIRQAAGKKEHLQRRYVVACAAKDMDDFRNYVARSVRHYKGRVRCYEIFNEPLFTTYSLPARFGYKMEDYLAHLRVAHDTIRSIQPDALVAGGIDIWAGHRYTREFVAAGGLQWVDVMTIHQYPHTVPPESYEDELAETRRMMVERGQAKPMWLTEYGCYADDDPWVTPNTIGDTTMSKCNWPSEQAASEALVKMAAVYGTYGVSKVFFHAGTSGYLNGRSGSGIFFEYGGAPRKMYPALSALANLLGPASQPLPPRIVRSGLRAYLFKGARGALAVVWRDEGQSALRLPAGAHALDIMGNRLPTRTPAATPTPLYLVADDAGALRTALARGAQ